MLKENVEGLNIDSAIGVFDLGAYCRNVNRYYVGYRDSRPKASLKWGKSGLTKGGGAIVNAFVLSEPLEERPGVSSTSGETTSGAISDPRRPMLW